MRYKYEKEHSSCLPCPPDNGCGEIKLTAYRLVSGISPVPEKDMVPPAVIDPTRGFSSKGHKCAAYALSYFTEKDEARNLYRKLINQVKAFSNLNHIAETNLEPSDGM